MEQRYIRDILIALAVKYEGNWEKMRKAIGDKERVPEKEVDELVSKVHSNVVTIIDANYPECLKRVVQPPFMIFYKGDYSLLEDHVCKLGIIGTRNNTPAGEEGVKSIINPLLEKDKGICLVSGMARGIDAIGQRCAMLNKTKTISVLGSGIDICYPKENKDLYEYSSSDMGLVISEYPDGVPPKCEHFPLRNRMIAAICDSLLVGEAKEASGTSITVHYALEMGKDILCIPQDVLSPMRLPNVLIHDGAGVCLDYKDILYSLRRRQD